MNSTDPAAYASPKAGGVIDLSHAGPGDTGNCAGGAGADSASSADPWRILARCCSAAPAITCRHRPSWTIRSPACRRLPCPPVNDERRPCLDSQRH